MGMPFLSVSGSFCWGMRSEPISSSSVNPSEERIQRVRKTWECSEGAFPPLVVPSLRETVEKFIPS